MAYHFPLTLEQRATLSIAISIWNNHDIKEKLAKCSDNIQQSGFRELDKKWRQFMKNVVEKVKKIVLPQQSKGELIHVVQALGEKIFNWYLHIFNKYEAIGGKVGDLTNYIREIYWTPLGTIDEVKILQSYWIKNPDLDAVVVYDFACQNVLEKDIDDLWQRMPCPIKAWYDTFNRETDDIYLYRRSLCDRIMFAYWKYRRDGHMDHFINFVVSNQLFRRNTYETVDYNQNYSVEYNMFLLSVCKGYSTAVKYFWKKLTHEERNSSALYSAYVTVVYNYCRWLWNNSLRYLREKKVTILIFLISQMTMSQKELLLKGESLPHELDISIVNVKNELLSMFLFAWPWKELFIPVLSDMLKYPEHNAEIVLEVLSNISEDMVEPSNAAGNNIHRCIFLEAWVIIPGSIKRRIIDNYPNVYVNSNFLINLLKNGNLDRLKMIFNDPEIEDVRMQYIKFGRRGYETLLEFNQSDLLDQFMEKVLRSEAEKKYLKSLIDHIAVCKSFIATEQYDLAEKFLNWKFETAVERKQCKDHFRDYDCFICWVVDTMDEFEDGMGTTKEKSSRFLKWCLGSEDDIVRFKKEFIVHFEPLIGEEAMISVGRRLSEKEAQNIRQILA